LRSEAEQDRKWEENQAELRRMNEALLAMAKKHDRRQHRRAGRPLGTERRAGLGKR
jgi:hypothetical protein